ncbi:PREDICTED: cyclin-dependent kinases regulatory subunit 2 [Pygoscelis adeliae]|uniref:cyclin-dependent kinases regulatory subunit 2 n=1 Tax=Pygoscelis adeliae TaxID=9238 RepID=UPI0004F50264|nr:PREDICTED: cyclin-dependent kinases regulatory subunit 2 [Pygoscelis adeliae]
MSSAYLLKRGPTRRGDSSTLQARHTEREDKDNGEIALSGNIPTTLTSSHRATTPMKYHWSSGKRRIQDLPTEKSQCQKEHSHVMLPRELSKQVPKSHLMSEEEWRRLGVQQSLGWVHYMIHEPEPHILLFRRPLPKDEQK